MKLGQTVIVRLNAQMAKEIGGNEANYVREENGQLKLSEPRKAPAIVVAIWGEGETPTVNLRVHGDGPGEFWAGSSTCGTEETQYSLE